MDQERFAGGEPAALRCMTSGRFTPAAMTFTRISPSPGEGTGALVATRTSGPPGSRMAMHVIDFGKWFFDMNTPCFKFPLRFGPAELLRRRPV